jgi:hypothetical protein
MKSHRLIVYPLGLGLSLMALACNRPSPAGSQSAAIKEEPAAALSDSAKVDSATARRTALAKVPNGKILQEELEREGGRLIYSFDIKSGTKPGVEEVQVDALDGSVVSVKHESAAVESDEAKKEGATHP